MHDLVIPNGNEELLVKRAKELGITSLTFLKQFKTAKEIKQYAESVKPNKIGLLIEVKSQNDLNKARVLKPLASVVVASSDSSENANRAIFECKWVNIATNIASSSGMEHTHYRRSGLNQVLAKLAFQNKQVHAINFAGILHSKNRPKLLGRTMQNVHIFSKYEVPITIYSFASEPDDMRNLSDLDAFLRVLS